MALAPVRQQQQQSRVSTRIRESTVPSQAMRFHLDGSLGPGSAEARDIAAHLVEREEGGREARAAGAQHGPGVIIPHILQSM